MQEAEEMARSTVERVLENIVQKGHTIQDDNYLCDIGLDSLDKIEVLMEIEEELNICIDDHHMDTVQDVGSLITLCAKALKSQ